MDELDRKTVDKSVWTRLIIGIIMLFGSLFVTVSVADEIIPGSWSLGGFTLPLLATSLFSLVAISSAICIKIMFALGKTDVTLFQMGSNVAGISMCVAWFVSLINLMFFDIALFRGAYNSPAQFFFIMLDFNILTFPVSLLMALRVGLLHGSLINDLKLAENGDDEAQMRVAIASDPSSNSKIVDIMAEIGNMFNKK